MSASALKAVATGQATAEQARSPYEALKRQLEQSKAEFLPLFGNSQQNVDRFVRVVLNAVLANGDLLECDRRSLITACMKAAQDGLLPDGREAVLNIYNSKVSKRGEPDRWAKVAQYLPMVGGLVKKLYACGEISNIDAACVFANDKFVYRRGDNPSLEHEPTMDDDAGMVVAAYVVVKMKSGEIKREVMPRRDIEAVRGASKSKDSGPWGTWYDQQAIKSVIKRAYKQLPKADAFEKIADYDNQALGFAATPASVGDIVAARHALEHQPGEVLEPTMNDGHAEVVGQQASEQSAAQQKAASKAPKVTYASVADQMMAAKNVDDLDAAASLIDAIGDSAQQDELRQKYDGLRKELAGA